MKYHRYGEIEGIAWMIGNAFWFAVTTTMVRHLSLHLEPMVILFFRNILAIPVLWLCIYRPGMKMFTTAQLPAHIGRAFVAMSAMGLWFYAITVMPLPEATALSFTTPLFTAIAAILFLGDPGGWQRWLAILAGFGGGLIILRPDPHAIDYSGFIVLSAAVCWALSNIFGKRLTRTEDPKLMVFYLTLFMAPLSLLVAMPFWETPSLHDTYWLVAISLVSNFSHFFQSKALAKAAVSTIMPFDFTRLIFISLMAYIFFNQAIDVWTVIGGAVIVASSVYIARREITVAKAPATTTRQPDEPLG